MSRRSERSSPTIRERHDTALRALAGAPKPRPLTAAGDGEVGPAHVGRFPAEATLPELTPGGLSHLLEVTGCVHVPGLIPEEEVEVLVKGIEQAFDAYDRHDGASETGDPWFDPFVPNASPIHSTRPWLRQGGGLFTADSPQLCARWLGLVRSTGLLGLVTSMFGEVPVTSLDKCALRRIGAGDGIEWHQDGSFLGPDSGAMNVWLSLSDTSSSPGLEIVGRRFKEIVETGSGGATYDWSTGPDVVAELAEEAPIERPHFLPGDALIFDGLLLHRTAQEPPPLPEVRYAIETWFFRPSRFPPHQQIPLAF